MAKNVLVLKHFESPKEAGTYHRLVCLTGSNKGESYVLSGNRIIIGRGDKADIRLNDTKASREHAEVTKVGNNWVATDLGSQNGIMVNDKKVTQQQLAEGDKLIVGQTVFKFAKVEVSGKAKTAKDKYDDEAPEGAGAKKTLVPMILMAGLIIYFVLGSDDKGKSENQGKSKKQTSSTYQDVSSEYLEKLKKRQANEDKAVKEKLNAIYQRGLREFREGNYFRAIAEFNLALIMSPGDPYAEYHLRKTKEKLDKTIEEFTIRAQRDEGALKFQSAVVSYCAIIRLLYTVPEDPRYKNAEKMIGDLESKMGMEPGETNCLKNHVPTTDLQVDTPDASERYEIYVGRSEDCHVQIDDPLISRHHFVLKNDNGKWYCEKLSQLGLVSINGQIAPIVEIHEGDEIKCGAYSILVSGLPTTIDGLAPQPVYQEAQPVHQAPTQAAAVQPIMDDEPLLDDLASEELPVSELDSTTVMNDDELAPEGEGEFLEQTPVESLDSFGEEENSFESSEEEGFGNSDEVPAEDSSMDAFGGEGGELATFGDEGGGDDSDEKTSFFKAFVNYQLVLFGDHAPYDRYEMDSNEIFIGRDPKKCQIVLDDPEVSSVHAVIKKNAIDVTLEDLNSSNGTILNGERINKAHLSTGDEFVIGSTSFTLETKSDLLEAESDRLMPVEAGQTIETEEIEEEIVSMDEGDVDFNSEGPPEKSLFKRIKKDPKFRKKVIFIVAGLGLAYLFLGDSETTKPVATETKTAPADTKKDEKPKIQLSKEIEQKRNMAYELGVSFFEQNKYFEALKEFQTVYEIDKTYKKIDTYLEQTKQGLKRLEELEAQKRAEEERLKTKKIIEELLVKAREAVKEKQVTVAENYFAQIAEKDPENIEVAQLKMELEAWQKEQERIALEKAAKEAARKAMVDALAPGKTFYLKKEWYKAILKLEEFLRRKGTDEDLVKEGSDMLSDAKNQLASELGPLVGKARSLKEGQDLKSAYEAYLEILKIEPTHSEALNEVDEIKALLETRSKKIYREAIIAESLSLFNDAKEKFQEVQQVSPSDSEYYKKATEKLRNYLE